MLLLLEHFHRSISYIEKRKEEKIRFHQSIRVHREDLEKSIGLLFLSYAIRYANSVFISQMWTGINRRRVFVIFSELGYFSFLLNG